MMAEPVFWRCNTCGNFFYALHDSGVNPVCCSKDMEKIEANTVDAAQEKHVPFVQKEDKHIVVNIGEIDHPMEDAHWIQWVALFDKAGNITFKTLVPGDAPNVKFCGKNVDEGTIYAYCNVHGLWKKEFRF